MMKLLVTLAIPFLALASAQAQHKQKMDLTLQHFLTQDHVAGEEVSLFIHGDADGWAAMNSVKCWEQLRRMGIQSDLHTLVGRGHCFQRTAAPGTGSYSWMGRIWEFMNHNGFNK